MTRKEMAKLAADECNSEKTTVRYGVKCGNPFWNVESGQFMYVPAFHFTVIRGIRTYRYDATDENGTVHTFTADDCCALLTPIWKDIPEGLVKLTVTAVGDDGKDYALAGARTFFKTASFPEHTPEAVCSYRECALKGYRYAMEQPFVKHLLETGKPDPHYDLNVYPCKILGNLATSMLAYARLCPEESENALKVAVAAADYLLSITPHDGGPLDNLPPTYDASFCPDPEKYGVITPNWKNAMPRLGTTMLIYPATAASMYIELEKATHDEKYLKAALLIGDYFKRTVLPCGSWILKRDVKTGKPLTDNIISPMIHVVPMLTALYERTKDESWRSLAEGAVRYTEETMLASYNWEGQFEDTPLSTNYHNLTHYGPVALAKYYAAYCPEKLHTAVEIMRFVEDQFVLWHRPYPFRHASPVGGTYDSSIWHTPAGLEQYNWYVPIDASTSSIASGFYELYKAGCGEIYLAKAKALMDQVTIMQHEDGKIPTHWMNTVDAEENFWFNCMFFSCQTLVMMAEE